MEATSLLLAILIFWLLLSFVVVAFVLVAIAIARAIAYVCHAFRRCPTKAGA